MRAFWNRSGTTLRVGFIAAMTLIAAGVAALVVTLLSTTHGSGAFEAGSNVSRLLLQAGAVIAMATLGAILVQRQRGKTDSH